MRLISASLLIGKSACGKPVAAEIDMALQQHAQSRQQAHGLIIGLEKYRRLKQQIHKAAVAGQYNGLPIIVDSTQKNRLSVF